MYKNLDKTFFRFVTIHAFDRRRDRQLSRFASPRWHSMQRGKKQMETEGTNARHNKMPSYRRETALQGVL